MSTWTGSCVWSRSHLGWAVSGLWVQGVYARCVFEHSTGTQVQLKFQNLSLNISYTKSYPTELQSYPTVNYAWTRASVQDFTRPHGCQRTGYYAAYSQTLNPSWTDNLSIRNLLGPESERDRWAVYPSCLWATIEGRIHFRMHKWRQKECKSSLLTTDNIWEAFQQKVSARSSAERTACTYKSYLLDMISWDPPHVIPSPAWQR